MKAIVTGGSGFIGSHLVTALKQRGYTVYCIDNAPENDCTGKYDINKIYKLHWDADIIYHLAAQADVQRSFDDIEGTFMDNVAGTLSVLEWAKKNNAKVVYAGSASKHAGKYTSPYATTKMMGEKLCKLYRKSFGLDIQIARFYNVFGEGQKQNVFAKWEAAIANNENPIIIGDGQQNRDFIHVDDVVEALIKLGESTITHKDAWEIGSSHSITINDAATMYHEKFGCTFDYVDDTKGNPRTSYIKNNDMKNVFGWKAKLKLIDYVTRL